MGRVVRRFALCLVAASALAACGGDDDPAAPDEGASATDATEAATDRAPHGRAAHADADTAKRAGTHAIDAAMAVLADPDADDGARAKAVAALAEAGPTAAAALVEWLRLPEDDPRAEGAVRALVALGIDAVPALVGLLHPPVAGAEGQDAGAVRAAALLAFLSPAWNRTDLAPKVAAAALAMLCLDGGGDDEVRDRGFALLRAAGPGAADACRSLVERLGRPDGGTWSEEVGDVAQANPEAFVPSAAALVALLRLPVGLPDVRRVAGEILAALPEIPPGAAEALLAMLRAPTADAAATDLARTARVAAAWTRFDPRLADEARRLLASDDPDVRTAVLQGWDAAPWLDADDAVRAAALMADADDGVRRRARDVAETHLDGRPDLVDVVARALSRATAADARGLCAFVEHRDEDVVDRLLPSLASLLASEDAGVRLAALRAADEATREGRAAFAAQVASLLGDPDLRVRVWAATIAAWPDDPPSEAIARAVRGFESLPDEDDRMAALRALSNGDAPGAAQSAYPLLDDPSKWVRGWARIAVKWHGAEDPPTRDAFRSMLQGLTSEDDDVRDTLTALFRAPGGTPYALDWLRERLASDDRGVVMETLRDLVWMETDAAAAIPLLGQVAARPEVRGAAEIALAAVDPDDAGALRRLDAALRAADAADVERLAYWPLRRHGAAGARLAVVLGPLPHADHDDARRFAETEPAAVATAVRELTSSADATARRRAAEWIEHLPASDARAVAAALLADTDAGVRVTAFVALRRHAEDDASLRPDLAAACVPALADRDTDVHVAAATALLALDTAPAAAAAPLRALLDHGPEWRGPAPSAPRAHLRGGAAAHAGGAEALGPAAEGGDSALGPCGLALERCGPAAASIVPVLVRALSRNYDASVVRPLVRAAGAMGPAAAPCVAAIRAALADARTSEFRVDIREDLAASCAEALGRIGAAARPALPDLRRLAAHPAYAAVARDAIRAIESAPR